MDVECEERRGVEESVMTIPLESWVSNGWCSHKLRYHTMYGKSEFQQRQRKDDESSYRLSLVGRTFGISKG